MMVSHITLVQSKVAQCPAVKGKGGITNGFAAVFPHKRGGEKTICQSY
jgi:hypothetical protein